MAAGTCRNSVNIAIVLDGSIQEEAKAKKVRSFVKQISQSFNIGGIGSKTKDGKSYKSTFSVGIINFGLSLHIPNKEATSNTRFERLVDSLKFTSASSSAITDYNELFGVSDGGGGVLENVLLTVEDYGTPHSNDFSKMVSALERTTRVSLC